MVSIVKALVYQSIQLIACEIITAPKEELYKINSKSLYYFKHGKAYWGEIDDITDIDERVQLLVNILNQCRLKADSDPAILKVFILPEFFFRGARGAYFSSAKVNAKKINEIIDKKLLNIINRPQWEGWLFIFGTAIFVHPYKNDYRSSNICIVRAGGVSKIAPLYISKESKSPVDYIKHNELPSRKWSRDIYLDREMIHYVDKSMKDIYFNYKKIKRYTQTSIPKDISFGLEVCLDHSNKRLFKNLNSTPNKVDIQIITSCGMEIDKHAVAVNNNGLVFLCDGAGYGVQIYRKLGNGAFEVMLNTSQYTQEYRRQHGLNLLRYCKDYVGISTLGSSKQKLFPKDTGTVYISHPIDLSPIEAITTLPNGVKTLSLFPDTSSGLTLAMSDDPILLNGMKVLFDNPTPTTAITLQPKQRRTNNGR